MGAVERDGGRFPSRPYRHPRRNRGLPLIAGLAILTWLVAAFFAPAPSAPASATGPIATATGGTVATVADSTPVLTSTTPDPPAPPQYPWHTSIASTSFWVGQVINGASDGSQVFSTYDPQWESHYGGCDGVVTGGRCQAEPRTAANGFFPTAMTPQQNPFYLDLPFDDVHNKTARAERARVIPWAHDPRYADQLASGSLMKNHWVELTSNGHTCFGQIEDAGPTVYDDAHYVFGTHDERPANKKINNAGLDVSPALNACLAFTHGYNSDQDRVNWRFVDETTIPPGPWTRIVTTNAAVRSTSTE